MPDLILLVVGGGGSGGARVGGGGGGGGYQYVTQSVSSSTSFNVVVGVGGAAVSDSPGVGIAGNNGSSSFFGSIVATGGGGGGAYTNIAAKSGSCGGGAAGYNTPPNNLGATGSLFYGGNSVNGSSGGGGGAGNSGSNGVDGNNGGAGGIGFLCTISGSAYYGGGGGGAGNSGGGAGGNGGGGAGAAGATSPATSGTANTGGGGGGVRDISDAGSKSSGAGGSGIVIVKFVTAQFGTVAGGDSRKVIGNETVITFTQNGTLTVNLFQPRQYIIEISSVTSNAAYNVITQPPLNPFPVVQISPVIPFTPLMVSGLSGWWKADSIVSTSGSSLATWSDSSGNNNILSSSAGVTPFYDTNQINGLPAVRFNAAQYFNVTGSTLVGFREGEIFGIVKIDVDPPVNANYSGLWNFGGTGERTHYPYTDGVIYDNFGNNLRNTTVNPAPALTTWRLYNVASSASLWSSSLDGTPLYSTSTNTVDFSGTSYVGLSRAGGGTDYFLSGWFSEILLFSRVLTTSERSQLKIYLANKYNLTIV